MKYLQVTSSIRITELCRVLPHMGLFTHLNILTHVTGLCYTVAPYKILVWGRKEQNAIFLGK